MTECFNTIEYLGILIAVLALYIAYRQYKNDRYRINIDLFDRRHEVYILLGNILGTLIQGLPKDDSKGFNLASEIGRCERLSKFLFPSNVQSEISEICKKGMRLMELYRRLKTIDQGGIPRGEERNKLSDEKSKIFTFMGDKLMNLESIFESQMNLTK
ncbi:hypothetical protein JYT89_00320 [Flavobacteriaceae bacterium AH-315-B10]|nr:hypothetical protein [Flavobacteriaceae bacterium AH-315-B10]